MVKQNLESRSEFKHIVKEQCPYCKHRRIIRYDGNFSPTYLHKCPKCKRKW